MVYCNTRVTGQYNPLYTLNNQFFSLLMWRTKFHDQTRTLCFLSEHRMALWAVGLPGTTLQKLSSGFFVFPAKLENWKFKQIWGTKKDMFKMSFIPVFDFNLSLSGYFNSNMPTIFQTSPTTAASCLRGKKTCPPPTFREEHQSHRRSAQLKHLGMGYHLWLLPKRFISGKKASKITNAPRNPATESRRISWFSSQNITTYWQTSSNLV